MNGEQDGDEPGNEERKYDNDEETSNSNDLSENDDKSFKLACLNSRSLNNKSTSLINIFDETEISVCLISETWLRDSKETKARLDDLEGGEDIALITKNRLGKRGGGVAIAYNKSRINLKELELSLIHISEPRDGLLSRMPSSA